MNTSSKIDLLNRNLVGYASLFYSEQSMKLSHDIEVQTNSEVTVSFNETFDFEGSVSRRDFIYIEKFKIFGLITDFSISNDNTATITFVTGADSLAHDVKLFTTLNANIGTTLAYKLTAEFVGANSQSSINLQIQNSSNRFGTLFSPDGVLEWTKLWRQVKRMHDVNVDISLLGAGGQRYLLVTIYDYNPSTFSIYTKDGNVLSHDVKFSSDQVTRYTAFDNFGNNFVFFLTKNGGITTDSNSSEIVGSFLDRKKYFDEALTFSKARSEAENEMLGKYDNSIELRLKKERFDVLNVGDKVNFVLDNKNIINTKVTKKEQLNDNVFNVSLGTGRRRLTDKLKR